MRAEERVIHCSCNETQGDVEAMHIGVELTGRFRIERENCIPGVVDGSAAGVIAQARRKALGSSRVIVPKKEWLWVVQPTE